MSAAQGFAARLALIRQQPDRAIQWLAGADVNIDCNTLHAFEHALMTRVKTLIAIGSVESLADAERDLRALFDRAERAHFEAQLVELWALEALVLHRQRRHAEAADAMERSLRAAPGSRNGSHLSRSRPGGFVDPSEPGAALEIDVLGCLAERLSYKEIGERLFISPMRVKRQAGSIYGKLDVGSRRQAMPKARALGWRPTA